MTQKKTNFLSNVINRQILPSAGSYCVTLLIFVLLVFFFLDFYLKRNLLIFFIFQYLTIFYMCLCDNIYIYITKTLMMKHIDVLATHVLQLVH